MRRLMIEHHPDCPSFGHTRRWAGRCVYCLVAEKAEQRGRRAAADDVAQMGTALVCYTKGGPTNLPVIEDPDTYPHGLVQAAAVGAALGKFRVPVGTR
jgi:hypothetical protein